MALERLVNLLETIAVIGRPLSVSEVIAVSGLPKPSCYRLVQTLLKQGLIDDPGKDGRYVVGERLIRIALMGKSDDDVERALAPVLKVESRELNEPLFLARLRCGKVEITHVEVPENPARDFIHPGLGKRPLHACSCSKVIAAFGEPEFRQKILDGKLERFTAKTKTTNRALQREFDTVRNQGYAVCDEEIDAGIVSVAAPIAISNIGVTFSIGIVGPVRRFGKDYQKIAGRRLKTLAERAGRTIRFCTGSVDLSNI